MDVTGKVVTVIGVGKTGLATVRFLAGRGARIALTDEKPPTAWGGARTALGEVQADLRIAPYGAEALVGAELVVPSPGVSPATPILREALRLGIPIVSELELAFRFLRTPVVAITGTNGKTTVTTLIGELLAAAGNRVFVGGNIGAPLIGYADGPQEADWAVVEVSSFQLQWASTFRPRVALLLNTAPDHVDYHGSFAAYREAKERIFACQGTSDTAVLNADEESTASLAGRIAARTEFFSSLRTVERGMFIAGENLIRIDPADGREQYPRAMIRLPGRHNIENVMAAIIAARACGCTPEQITDAVERFRGIGHRIEYVDERGGVRYYDDSKGTNVAAVVRALESFSDPVVLLLGGRDKEGDFETLIPLLRQRVKAMVLFGEARGKIDDRIGGVVATALAATLGEAVEAAGKIAAPGEVVLLSPGCASFDEFTGYKERGERFQEMVRRLKR